jgi:hypothetical protein
MFCIFVQGHRTGTHNVPQIWVTYDELAEFCGCSSDQARMQVIQQQWPRRRSRDRQTRVKLPPALMRDYVGHLAAQWQGIHAAAEVEMIRTFARAQAATITLSEPELDTLADQTSARLKAILPPRPLARRA